MKTASTDKLESWSDLLPSKWKADRLGKFADIIVSNVNKKTEDDEEPVLLCNYVDVYKNDRITSGIPFMEASATPHEIAKFTLYKDDVVTTKDSESPLDIAIPSLVAEDVEGLVCGYHLAILRADRRNLFGPFLAWLHVSQTIRSHYEMHACGITRWAVGRNLLSRSKPLAFFAEGQFWVNNHAHIIKPWQGNEIYWVNLLESQDYSLAVTGSAQPKLNMQNFGRFQVPVPPLVEQNEIADFVLRRSAECDKVKDTLSAQITTLTAYRKSLIHECVTGKRRISDADVEKERADSLPVQARKA
jgi:Type I restriction modification DNA specificity domain